MAPLILNQNLLDVQLQTLNEICNLDVPIAADKIQHAKTVLRNLQE